MEATRKVALRRIVLAGDGLAAVLAMVAAFLLHSVLRGVLPLLKDPPRFGEYALLLYLAVPLWLLLVTIFELDRCFERPWRWTGMTVDLAKMHVVGLIGLAVILFVTQSVVNRSLVAFFLVGSFMLMLLERVLIGWWLEYQHDRGQGQVRILFVGEAVAAMNAFIEQARRDPLPPEFIGYLTGSAVVAEGPGSLPPRLGAIDDLEDVLHREAVDQVLFFPPFDQPDRAGKALRVSETVGVPASFPIKFHQPFEAKPQLQLLYGRPFVTFEMAPKSAAGLAAKYAVDFTLAALCLLLLAPVFLVTSLAILVSMGHPVFFTQERAGLYGRRFRMLKFRTMQREAEAERDALLSRNEMHGPVFKIAADPRITPLGRWLRKFSVDELPQLINVLLGSMSLVGPRPLPVREQQAMRGWHRRRLSVKPGITGLWQVSGRNDIDFEEWMKLDLYYVDEWSLRLDTWILARTIPAVLAGRGAF